tara:strand:- start:99 stop:923 length:825 start_codon:yes stop_codon:yes gene_type:complete
MEHKDNYYSRDAVSASLLKSVVKQSAVHAEERMKPSEGTQSMRLGTAFHARLLEAEDYENLIAVSPLCDRRTKAGKEIYAEFVEVSKGKTVITAEQGHLLEGMIASANAHPIVNRLLEECYATEFQTFWEIDGIPCKAMIDACSDKGVIVDVKTTIDASPEAFSRASFNYQYHLQLAWYANAMGIVGDDKDLNGKKDFSKVDAYIIAVENTAPFGVAVYKFSTDALESGWELCKQGFNTWKEHKLNKAMGDGTYPYSTEVLDLDLPYWASRKES